MARYILCLALFALWWIGLALLLISITLDVGELPVDYRTYASAAELLRETGSPYTDTSTARDVWQAMHESAVSIFRQDGGASGEVEVISGPYLYPPSLALALEQLGIPSIQFIALLIAATIGLCIGWLHLIGERSVLWLLGMAGSIDLIAIFLGGNVELLLIALSLAACWVMWQGHAFLTAVLMAVVILVKPQFALLFLAFGSVHVFTAPMVRPVVLRSLTVVGMVLLFILLESLRWPEGARSDFLAYAVDPVRFQYFALPEEAQWPMNIWNRAPLQVFLTIGFNFEVSQVLSLALYVFALGTSIALLRGRRVGFAVIFALAYILFLVGRPITWSMPFLAVFTLTAAWPALSRTERRLGLLVAFLISSTHWAAFVLFAAGVWPGLLTLQVPGLPWETLGVLFSAWVTLVFSSRRTVGDVVV